MPHRSDPPQGRPVALTLTLALVAGAGSAALLVWLAAGAQAPAASDTQEARFPWARATASADPAAPPGRSASAAAVAPPPFATIEQGAARPPGQAPGLDPTPRRVFLLDAQGRLVVDQPLRLRTEALLALNEGPALAARLDAELAGMPPAAAARARELVSQFEAYQSAQAAAFAPGQPLLVPEEGLAQLAAMQALRAAHFGAETARQLFAQDDAVARRILELMREDTSTARSMEEKAMRAQVRYDQERGAVPP